jgi:hypothetical protein
MPGMLCSKAPRFRPSCSRAASKVRLAISMPNETRVVIKDSLWLNVVVERAWWRGRACAYRVFLTEETSDTVRPEPRAGKGS